MQWGYLFFIKKQEKMDAKQLVDDILALWKTTDAFQQSLTTKSEKLSYTFYDGPPFTSGDPHYGHLLQSIVKDMVPRRMAMRGYRVARKRGRDCHGIPAENFVNKQLGITSRKQVEEEFGIGNYVEACRSMVNQVNDNWKWTIDHIGRRVDMEHAYFTMDNEFMESVICLFSDLYHRNLIYKGFKVLGYSRALGTALSNSEIMEGYEMRQDPAVTVKLQLKNENSHPKGEGNDHAIEVVAGVIKNANGDYLMLYDNKNTARYFPGGKIESGESPADALKREIKEELDVVVTSEKFLGHSKTIHAGKLYRIHYFAIEIAGTPTLQEPTKHGMLERIQKIPSENEFGYVLKFTDLIISDTHQLRHEFADIHMFEQDLISEKKSGEVGVYLLPRTTTPWTLPANMFAAVHRDIEYIQLFDRTTQEYYILATACVSRYYKSPAEYIEVTTFKGAELIGFFYEPLFLYYHETTFDISYKAQVHRVLHADFVTTESGTGIVHEAPAFGADDYELVAGILGKDNAAERLFDPVNAYGEFTDLVPDFSGQNVIEANSAIIKNLKDRGLLVKHETINHSYPHCPRTGTPLIYKAIESRFVKEEELKAETIPAAEQIHFVPETVKNRFIEILKTAPDRNISRTRFRGAPLPVRECGACNETVVCGSISEIEQRSGQTVTDLHRPYIDEITFPCTCGATMHRIPEVLDCRFESGSMPYGQDHWMKKIENGKLRVEKLQEKQTDNLSLGKEVALTQGVTEDFSNCADFIAEGLDQTRGWFRVLHVLGHAYHHQNVFRNVVVTGMILAEDGKKMSKRLKNYPDPSALLNQYGADPLRLYLLSSPVVRAEPLRFSEKAVEQMLKDVVIPLQNVFNFFQMYAEVDQWKDAGTQVRFMRHALKASIKAEKETTTGWITTEGETIEDKELPLSEAGFAQLTSPEFIENIVRIQPEVIVCSDFLRTRQTAEGVQRVLEEYLGKAIEIESTSDRCMDAKRDEIGDAHNTFVAGEFGPDAKPIGEIYQALLHKHAGKRILIVSHKRRFRYLRQWLCNIPEDINAPEVAKRYFINFEQPVPLPLTPVHNELDQRILAELHRTIGAIDSALAGYTLDTATKELTSFVDDLTNRYLRRSRRRFRSESMDADKQQAYQTLFTVIRTYLQLAASFIPFITEQIWQSLSEFTLQKADHPSVHLQGRPLGSPVYINHSLIEEVETVRKIIKGAMYLRAKHQIKVKQPLQKLEFRV